MRARGDLPQVLELGDEGKAAHGSPPWSQLCSARPLQHSYLQQLGGGRDCQQLPPHGLFLGQCSSSLPTRDGCHSPVRAEEHGQGSGMAPLHGMTDLGDTFCGILDM